MWRRFAWRRNAGRKKGAKGMKTVEEMECLFPRTLDEALQFMSDGKKRGKPLAGGTDLMAQWASGVGGRPDRVISLLGVEALKDICESAGGVNIGANVTHAAIRASACVRQHLPGLAAAAATVGGAQIQARGTIAGNVANASPAGDLAPALLVTGGFVVAASMAGERTIPLSRFYLGYRKVDLRPDELIVRFILPKLPMGSREIFRKLGTRSAQAISKVMGCCRAEVVDGVVKSFAVALGSVAPIPARLPEYESWIVGKRIDPDTIDESERMVASLVNPIDDIRSTAGYRRWVAGRLVRGFLEELAD